MRTRIIVAVLLATVAVGPAAAQDRGSAAAGSTYGLPGEDSDFGTLGNIIGLCGLLGFIGLLPKHEEDSYHPASIE